MKIILNFILITLLLPEFLLAQSRERTDPVSINAEYKEAVVKEIVFLVNDFYVFPDVAKETGLHLQNQLKKGFFNQFNDVQSFSSALTSELQSVNKDKHMRVIASAGKKGNKPANEIDAILWSKKSNNAAGFAEVKLLENNIGYLDIRSFPGLMNGVPTADAYMKLLKGTDAVIIDLRRNGGGSPEMVQYLCSYFFDEKVHLNSIYSRQNDETKDYWVLEKVNGEKRADVPLFILTSNYTFSGAEEFAYNMQTQKRATLIGETTGGGANPGGTHKINNELMIFIPDGRAINPVTKTNWEGTGVKPEINTDAEKALDKSIELATLAAEKYRQDKYDTGKKLLTDLFNKIDSKQETEVLNRLKLCVKKGTLNEMDINLMGYNKINNKELDKAEIILKSNTILFPNSANTYDSYAEVLSLNNKNDLALQNYETAVKLAEKNKDEMTGIFKENLDKFKQTLGSK